MADELETWISLRVLDGKEVKGTRTVDGSSSSNILAAGYGGCRDELLIDL